MSLKKQLLRVGLASIIIRVIGTALSFFLAVILARTLGADGFGIYSFVLSLLIILAIPIQSGFPNLAVRETSKASINGNWLLIKGIWLWTVKIISIYTLLLLLLFLPYFFNIHWLSNDRQQVLIVGFFLIPFIAILNTQGAIIRGLGKVIIGIIPDTIIRPGLALIFMVFVISFSSKCILTPHTAMLLYTTSVFSALCISFILMWRLIPKNHRNLALFNIEKVKWKKAVYPLTIVGGLQIMYVYIDIIILGFFHSDQEVGIYRVVGQLGTLVVFGLTAINQMLHPYFSKLYATKDMHNLQKIVSYSSLAIFAFATIPALIFLVGGEFILKFIFGDLYVMGFVPLIILTIGQLANATFGSVGALLNMTGHEKDAMRGMFYSLFINVILAFLLIPQYGMVGAAISTAISLVVWNMILHYYVKKRLDIESIGFIQIYKQRGF